MKRLLMRTSLQEVLREESIRVDVEDTYQVYAAVWSEFKCENCGRKELYRDPKAKFSKQRWVAEAAMKARVDGWHVGQWSEGGGMDCAAYCPKCKGEESG